MKGIHPNTCIHHMYMDPNIPPVRQPQRRMNPALKDIVKEELQKLLTVDFIYPISGGKMGVSSSGSSKESYREMAYLC